MNDENGRIRIVLGGKNPVYGWATSAPGNKVNPAGGYTVEWDDDWEDHEDTRWYFDDDDSFMAIKAV